MASLQRELPPFVRIAQIFAITASAGVAGAGISTSLFAVPGLKEAPSSLAAKQWKKIFDASRISSPASIAISAIFGYLAYREEPSGSAFKLYTAAAVLIPASIPFTTLLVNPVNSKLNARAQSTTEAATGEDTHALVEKWAALNLMQSTLALAAAVLGSWAAIGHWETAVAHGIGFTSGADRLR